MYAVSANVLFCLISISNVTSFSSVYFPLYKMDKCLKRKKDEQSMKKVKVDNTSSCSTSKEVTRPIETQKVISKKT